MRYQIALAPLGREYCFERFFRSMRYNIIYRQTSLVILVACHIGSRLEKLNDYNERLFSLTWRGKCGTKMVVKGKSADQE